MLLISTGAFDESTCPTPMSMSLPHHTHIHTHAAQSVPFYSQHYHHRPQLSNYVVTAMRELEQNLDNINVKPLSFTRYGINLCFAAVQSGARCCTAVLSIPKTKYMKETRHTFWGDPYIVGFARVLVAKLSTSLSNVLVLRTIHRYQQAHTIGAERAPN